MLDEYSTNTHDCGKERLEKSGKYIITYNQPRKRGKDGGKKPQEQYSTLELSYQGRAGGFPPGWNGGLHYTSILHLKAR